MVMDKINKRTLDLFRKIATVMAPPPIMTISEWADENRRLSAEASAEPGRWNTDRAPFQREIMNAVNDDNLEEVVVMSSSQVGKALDIHTPIATIHGWTTMGDRSEERRVGNEC